MYGGRVSVLVYRELYGYLDDTQTCNGINNEWELCTPELFESTDDVMYTIITNPQYKLPQLAPNGNYCPSNVAGDINGDGISR